MEINKIVQLNGKYIKGTISKRVVKIDSLHITTENGSGINKFTIPELEQLIKELQTVRNEMDDNVTVTVSERKPHFYD